MKQNKILNHEVDKTLYEIQRILGIITCLFLVSCPKF